MDRLAYRHLNEAIEQIKKATRSNSGINSPWIAVNALPKIFKVNASVATLFCIDYFPFVKLWNVEDAIKKANILNQDATLLDYYTKLYEYRMECSYDRAFLMALLESLVKQLLLESSDSPLFELFKQILQNGLQTEHAVLVREQVATLLQDKQHVPALLYFFELTNQWKDSIQILVQQERAHDLQNFLYAKQSSFASLLDSQDMWMFLFQYADSHAKQVKNATITPEVIVGYLCMCVGSIDCLQLLNSILAVTSAEIDTESMPALHSSAYRKVCELARTEIFQSKLKHEMLENVDSYMWSEKETHLNAQTRLLLNKKTSVNLDALVHYFVQKEMVTKQQQNTGMGIKLNLEQPISKRTVCVDLRFVIN